MIFPDWGTAPETNESPLPLFREWAVDWESGALALRGRSGDAGIRESLLKRTITETLLVCPYITGVEGFSFEHRADGATVRFTVKTVYNSFETEAETA